MKLTPILAATLVALVMPAAAETMSGGGQGTGTTNNTVLALSDTHLLIGSNSVYDSLAFEDAAHAMNGASGACFGAIEVVNGAASGGGKCAYADPGGDMWTVDWVVGGMGADGAVTGTWSVNGGTGKWNGASGGGTFSSLADPETNRFVNTITSVVTLP